MRKSQVVATLAVASAMGVVAPLTSTASAWEVTNNQVGQQAGEATCGELKTAVSFLERQAGYRWYDELATANKKVADGEYADISNTENLWINVITNAANTITFDTTNQYGTDFKNNVEGIAKQVDLSDDGEGNAVPANSIAATRLIMDSVNGNKYYQFIKPIVEDLNASASAATLAGHVRNFKNSGLPGADKLTLNENTILTDYQNGAAIDAVYGNGAYTWFNSLVNLMNVVTPEYGKAVAGKAAYETLLNPAGVLADASVAAYKNYDKDTNPIVVANLKGMANNNADLSATTNAWATVRGDIASYIPVGSPDGAPICTEDTLRSQNFARVWDLATQYKAISGSKENIEKVAESLISYVAPVNPGDDNNKPGENQPGNSGSNTNKPEDNKNNSSAAGTINANKGTGINKNGTPNTGVAMATVEGTSAKSAGLISTLISVITAMGAGLTVIRRNKKNA